MIDRADFEERIAKAIHKARKRCRGRIFWYADCLVESKQIADRLPALFRTEEIEI
jgi:hypothetical protein